MAANSQARFDMARSMIAAPECDMISTDNPGGSSRSMDLSCKTPTVENFNVAHCFSDSSLLSCGEDAPGNAGSQSKEKHQHTIPPGGEDAPFEHHKFPDLVDEGKEGVGSNSNRFGGRGRSKKRFVGVRQRPSGRWVAEIKDTTQKIRLWLGTFDTAEAAARAYDEAAWLLRGANTRTNFVAAPSDGSVLPSKAARLLLLRQKAAAAKLENGEARIAAVPVASPAQAHHSYKAGVAEDRIASTRSLQSQQSTTRHHLPSDQLNLPVDNNLLLREQQRTIFMPYDGHGDYENEYGNHKQDSHGDLDHGMQVCRERELPLCREREVCAEGEYISSCPVIRMQSESACSYNANDMCSERDLRISQSPTMCMKEEVYTSHEMEYKKSKKFSGSAILREREYPEIQPLSQESDETDMSSGLTGLSDVDVSCEDSGVYTSSFDFSSGMAMAGPAGLDLPAPMGGGLSDPLDNELDTSTLEEPILSDDGFNEHLLRMKYERSISASLYAMNGVQECLLLSYSPGVSYSMSSPSLSLSPTLCRGSSSPFLSSSPLWKVTSNGGWGQPSVNAGTPPPNFSAAEGGECPSQEALWNSWDLPPLCVVA